MQKDYDFGDQIDFNNDKYKYSYNPVTDTHDCLETHTFHIHYHYSAPTVCYHDKYNEIVQCLLKFLT